MVPGKAGSNFTLRVVVDQYFAQAAKQVSLIKMPLHTGHQALSECTSKAPWNAHHEK